MASPFRVFRKHQKPIIVVAGVGLLVVWLLGDALTSWAVRAFGGPGRPREGYQASDVAVTYRGGQLTRGELDALVFKRRVLMQFLGSVHSLARTRCEPDATLAVEPIVPFGIQRDDPNIREKAFYSFLLGEAAEREGMAVGKDAVDQYLTEVCMQKVESHELTEIASRMSQGNRVISMGSILKELRRELLAFGYLQSQQFALTNVLPEQRFTDWLRINDRIKLEVAALPALRFAVNVEQPSDDEVQALYDHYKDAEPTRDIVASTDLPSPKPGFKTPRRVRLKFLEVSFDGVRSELAAEVTDEEIAAYYEEQKDPDFIRPEIDVQPLEEEPGETAEEPGETAEEPGETVEEPGETDDASTPADDDTTQVDDESTPPTDEPASPDDESDATADDSADADAEAEDSASDGDAENPEGDSEAETPASDDAGAPADAPESPDTPGEATNEDDGDNATVDRETPFRLVAFQEDGAEPATDSEPAAEPVEKPVEFLPLDEVREEIRERIAADRVPARQGEISSEIISKLQIAFDEYETRLLEREASDESADVGPPNFDLEKLAAEHGARLEETSDVSFLELRQMDPIGISFLRSGSMAFAAALCQAVFQDEELYRPIVSTQPIGGADPVTGSYRVNEFVTVKVSDTPARVPELDEIRDDVIRAWRLQRASEMAFAEAKDLAEKARSSELPLTEMLADDEDIEVTDTDAFSWLTMGFDARRVRLSEPYGVEAAGPDFMRDVFAMADGDVKAVLNHDHSIAYVVRAIGRERGQDELRRDFLAEVDRWYGMPVLAATHRNEMNQAYGKGLETLYEVNWQIDPAEQRQGK